MNTQLSLGVQLDKFKKALEELQKRPENSKAYRRRCLALQRAIADTRAEIIRHK